MIFEGFYAASNAGVSECGWGGGGRVYRQATTSTPALHKNNIRLSFFPTTNVRIPRCTNPWV